MKYLVLLILCLSGCAIGKYSAPGELSPVAHRGTRALIGASLILGQKEIGIKPKIAIVTGTVVQVGILKSIMAVRHPDWIGPWTPGDIVCDIWTSAAIVPIVLGREFAKDVTILNPKGTYNIKATIISGVIWGTGMIFIDDWCIP